MAAISWINNAGGTWSVASNWSSGAVPGSGDDAYLTSGSFYTVLFQDASATSFANSVSLNDATVTLELASGTLDVAGDLLLVNGLLELNGATLEDATVRDDGGAVLVAGGTLNHVTWLGPLDIGTAHSTVTVVGGLSVEQADGLAPGVINLTGDNSVLWLADPEVLDNVILNIGSAGSSTTMFTFQLSNGFYVPNPVSFGTAAQINVTAGANVISYSTLTNSGTIAIEGGASLQFESPTTNQFVNAGSISIAADGTLVLAGDESLANLGNISSSGGQFVIGGPGNLDLAGGTLTIANGTAFQNFKLTGTMAGGSVIYQSGTATFAGTLNNVVWYGPLNLASLGDSVRIVNGFTVLASDGSSPGVINLSGAGSGFVFGDTETLDNVTINVGPIVDPVAGYQVIGLDGSSNGGLTIGGSVTVNDGIGTGNTFNVQGGTLTNLAALNQTSGDILISVTQFNNGGMIDAAASGATFTVGAQKMFNSGSVLVSGGDQMVVNAPVLLNSGVLMVDTASTIEFQNAASNVGSLAFSGYNGLFRFDQLAALDASIAGWGYDDRIEFAPSATYTFDPRSTNDTLVIDGNGSQVATFSIGAGYTLGEFSIAQGSSGAPSFIQTNLPCFAHGTRIRTVWSEVAVEELRAGDSVEVLLGSGTQRIVRVGKRRVDCLTHPDPKQVWPVRVARGAFGSGRPYRDLFLSPDHAVFVRGVLIPIKYLINGGSVMQEMPDEVVYYHIELPYHDVLVAEGLQVESFLRTGARSNFTVNHVSAADMWETEGCAPLVVMGPELAAARRWMDALSTVPRPFLRQEGYVSTRAEHHRGVAVRA